MTTYLMMWIEDGLITEENSAELDKIMTEVEVNKDGAFSAEEGEFDFYIKCDGVYGAGLFAIRNGNDLCKFSKKWHVQFKISSYTYLGEYSEGLQNAGFTIDNGRDPNIYECVYIDDGRIIFGEYAWKEEW